MNSDNVSARLTTAREELDEARRALLEAEERLSDMEDWWAEAARELRAAEDEAGVPEDERDEDAARFVEGRNLRSRP